MKQLIQSLIVVVCACLLGSCTLPGKSGNQNSDGSSGSTKPGDGSTNSDGQTFTAQVDGKSFTGKNIRATVTTIAGKPFFNITAFSHDLNYHGPNEKESIGFNVEGELKPGDFSFDGNGKANPANSHGAYNAGSPDNDIPPSTVYGITSGKLSITKYDPASKTAVGTFEFTAVNQDGKSVTIDHGQFSGIAF